jgi:hypothetical protein
MRDRGYLPDIRCFQKEIPSAPLYFRVEGRPRGCCPHARCHRGRRHTSPERNGRRASEKRSIDPIRSKPGTKSRRYAPLGPHGCFSVAKTTLCFFRISLVSASIIYSDFAKKQHLATAPPMKTVSWSGTRRRLGRRSGAGGCLCDTQWGVSWTKRLRFSAHAPRHR